MPLKRWEYSRYRQKHSLDTEVEGIRWGVIRSTTDVVIEGYPRSGNTFASVAFRYAQPAPIRMAYRLHAPIQLIEAIHRKIPAVVLVRNPEDAVLSWVIHRPHLTIPQALQGYVRFYKRVLPYLNDMVVAEFNTTVSDYGKVIRDVNDKFGTQFVEFDHTEENVKRCFDIIDEFYRKAGAGKVPEQIVARPSENRKQKKELLRSQFHTDSLTNIRREAMALYEKFVP
ncbi:MAG: hypothetical protein AAF821_10155 [Cyanobacteria bacterium P01_D01_bin.156]